MLTTSSVRSQRVAQAGLIILTLCFVLSVHAYGGDAHLQQQANQQKAQLDHVLQHAHTIGVPPAQLTAIMRQEQQVSNTITPLTFLSDQPATNYYRNLSIRYQQLLVQTQGLLPTITAQLASQAQLDLQNFQLALAQQRIQGLGNIAAFSQQFHQDQSALADAHTPKDYTTISHDARDASAALHLIGLTHSQLNTFQQAIAQMDLNYLDTTTMQAAYQDDLHAFTTVTTLHDFQNIGDLIDAQYQQTVVNSIQALPYVNRAKFNLFQDQVNQLKIYGGNESDYEQRLIANQRAMNSTKTFDEYMLFSHQIDGDLTSVHHTLLQSEAKYLFNQFQHEVDSWGSAHAFHDGYDGQAYALDNGYMKAGLGSDLNGGLAQATTTDDYQNVVNEENNALFNLSQLKTDNGDKTAYNQVHATDLAMLGHYKIQQRQVLMISLVEQAMRVYQNGKLVRAFHVTTGRQELPSVPGVWSVLDRESPTIFKSSDPKSSPYWYPDTPIQYAILYHQGGYFIHDAGWRGNFGPGTQFPHNDSSGTTSFNFDGSHGCINMQPDEAGWVYQNTNWNTLIAVY